MLKRCRIVGWLHDTKGVAADAASFDDRARVRTTLG
jgi:hypothetical protein